MYFGIGIMVLLLTIFYCGLLTYATYYDCDPLMTKLAKAKDQLFPLLVMKVLKDIPGMPGVFVAGVFSASLRCDFIINSKTKHVLFILKLKLI